MDEQGRQRVAADGGDPRRAPERARADHPLRRRREEEVGRELGFHGAVRLRLRPRLLGLLGLPPLLRRPARPDLGEDKRGSVAALSVREGVHREFPQRYDGVFPVRVRRHHVDTDRRRRSGEDELLCMDALCSAVAHLLLHHRSLHHLVG